MDAGVSPVHRKASGIPVQMILDEDILLRKPWAR